MAGVRASRQLRRDSKFRPDQKGAFLALGIVLIVLFLMYWFGEPPPLPD